LWSRRSDGIIAGKVWLQRQEGNIAVRVSSVHRVAGKVLVGLVWVWAIPACVGQTLRVVPTYNNLGIELTFASAPPAGTAVAVGVREAASAGPYRTVQPLCRIEDARFAGSVFCLESGVPYALELTSAALGSPLLAQTRTRIDEVIEPAGRTYHVAPDGDDGHGGLSRATAFATLAHALDAVTAGDRIRMHTGRYYEGDIEVYAGRSGTPTAPILIENAPGERVVLDGTDVDFDPQWTVHDAARGIYRSPCTRTPDKVYLSGEHLFRFQRYEDLRDARWEQSTGCCLDGTWLYVRFPGGAAPGTHTVTIPGFSTALTLGASHYQVRGLEICYYGYGPYHRGIYLQNGSSNLVERCAFHHNVTGVALKRSANHNTIQHCRFSETPLRAFSWAAIKQNGVQYEAGGVYVYGSGEANEGNVVRFNLFEELFDGCHLYPDHGAPTRNMDFHDNILRRCGDDGIETDGLGSNVRIYSNVFDRFLSGISLAPARVGPTYIMRNVLSGWHAVDGHDGTTYEGYPFKFNHGMGGTTSWVFLYHNTCYTDEPEQDAFMFKNYSDWTNIVSRNNIYAGTHFALSTWSDPGSIDFDYDNLFTTDPSRFVDWDGTRYGDLAAFSAGTGHEIHGVSVEPRFRGEAYRDFRLRADSPLVDRGVHLPGVNDDFIGRAPDIGALEFRHAATGVGLSNGQVMSRWDTVSGCVYRLEGRGALRSGAWGDAGPVETARTHTLEMPLPASTESAVFYRLIQVDGSR